MPKYKIHRIDIDVYNSHFYYISKCSAKHATKIASELLEIELPEPESTYTGFTYNIETDEGNYYVMWVKDPKSLPILCHEAVHVGHFMLNEKGVEFGESAESLAYLVGYITEKVLEIEKGRG